jgi:hypothetical protein
MSTLFYLFLFSLDLNFLARKKKLALIHMYVSFQSTTPTAAMETCTWSCANKWGFDHRS